MNKKAEKLRENLAIIATQVSALGAEDEYFFYDTVNSLIEHKRVGIDNSFKPPIKLEKLEYYSNDGILTKDIERKFNMNGQDRLTVEITTEYAYTDNNLSSAIVTTKEYNNQGNLIKESTTTTNYLT